MKKEKKSRRSFILTYWGASLAAAVTGGWIYSRKQKETETAKMLTEDGQLVEIDKRLLHATGKKIKEEDLHTWVKNKTSPTKTN